MMQNTPTATSHQAVVAARTNSATAATVKQLIAAAFTAPGLTNFDPTKRSGPTRSSSVPRIPSE